MVIVGSFSTMFPHISIVNDQIITIQKHLELNLRNEKFYLTYYNSFETSKVRTVSSFYFIRRKNQLKTGNEKKYLEWFTTVCDIKRYEEVL